MGLSKGENFYREVWKHMYALVLQIPGKRQLKEQILDKGYDKYLVK